MRVRAGRLVEQLLHLVRVIGSCRATRTKGGGVHADLGARDGIDDVPLVELIDPVGDLHLVRVRVRVRVRRRLRLRLRVRDLSLLPFPSSSPSSSSS